MFLFSATSTKRLLPQLFDRIDIHCLLSPYSFDEVVLIVQQRFILGGWEYESEDVLKNIANYANGCPGTAVKLLEMGYRVMRSQDENIMTIEHIETAISFSPAKNISDLSGEE